MLLARLKRRGYKIRIGKRLDKPFKLFIYLASITSLFCTFGAGYINDSWNPKCLNYPTYVQFLKNHDHWNVQYTDPVAPALPAYNASVNDLTVLFPKLAPVCNNLKMLQTSGYQDQEGHLVNQLNVLLAEYEILLGTVNFDSLNKTPAITGSDSLLYFVYPPLKMAYFNINPKYITFNTFLQNSLNSNSVLMTFNNLQSAQGQKYHFTILFSQKTPTQPPEILIKNLLTTSDQADIIPDTGTIFTSFFSQKLDKNQWIIDGGSYKVHAKTKSGNILHEDFFKENMQGYFQHNLLAFVFQLQSFNFDWTRTINDSSLRLVALDNTLLLNNPLAENQMINNEAFYSVDNYQDTSSNSVNVATICGIIVGSILIAILLATIIYFLWKRRHLPLRPNYD